jgi:hypothetical protein
MDSNHEEMTPKTPEMMAREYNHGFAVEEMSHEDIEQLKVEAYLAGYAAANAKIEALERHNAELLIVARCAQGVLTCLNIGNVQSESPLHLDLRKTMIQYRTTIAHLTRQEKQNE